MDQQRRPNGLAFYPLTYRHNSGTTTAVVVPEWGANVVGLAFHDHRWSWPVPILESVDLSTIASGPTSYGMPILAPTPGRVGRDQSGLFLYRGKQYRITPPRHGFLRNLPWQIASISENAIACTIDIRPDDFRDADAFPFHFEAANFLTVSPGALQSRVVITNTGTDLLPIAMGWHPYLHRSGECVVHLPARSRWELDDKPEPTPTGVITPVSDHDDFRHGRRVLPDDHWDHVFTDLEMADEHVLCCVEEPTTIANKDGTRESMITRRRLELSGSATRAGSGIIPHVQLYTPRGRNAICLEPLSAPPDALNLLARGHRSNGISELQPNDTISFEIELSITVRPAAAETDASKPSRHQDILS